MYSTRNNLFTLQSVIYVTQNFSFIKAVFWWFYFTAFIYLYLKFLSFFKKKIYNNFLNHFCFGYKSPHKNLKSQSRFRDVATFQILGQYVTIITDQESYTTRYVIFIKFRTILLHRILLHWNSSSKSHWMCPTVDISTFSVELWWNAGKR